MFAALGYEISAQGFVFGVLLLSRKDCDGVSVSFVPSGPASGEREDSWIQERSAMVRGQFYPLGTEPDLSTPSSPCLF